MNWFTRTLNLNYIPDNEVFFHCQIVVRVFVVYESNCIGLKYIKYEWNLEHVMEYIYLPVVPTTSYLLLKAFIYKFK